MTAPLCVAVRNRRNLLFMNCLMLWCTVIRSYVTHQYWVSHLPWCWSFKGRQAFILVRAPSSSVVLKGTCAGLMDREACLLCTLYTLGVEKKLDQVDASSTAQFTTETWLMQFGPVGDGSLIRIQWIDSHIMILCQTLLPCLRCPHCPAVSTGVLLLPHVVNANRAFNSTSWHNLTLC
jgi:hypothetical protein